MKSDKKIFILSCCGGGTRGIISSLILDKICEKVGKHPTQLFDIMIGTSTGSIITTILNVPLVVKIIVTDPDGKESVLDDTCTTFKYNTKDLVHIYQNETNSTLETSMWKKFSTMNGMYGNRYSVSVRNKKFKEWLQDVELKDTLSDLIITSYDMCKQQPVLFKSRKAKLNTDENYILSDVLKASTAAPTIWPPFEMNDTLYIDALYAKNPTLFGVIEAIKHYNVDPSNIYVLSIGTGYSEHEYSIPQVTTSGIDFLSSVFDSTLIANNISSLYITNLLIGKNNILRMDVGLQDKELGICDLTEKTVCSLIEKTRVYIQERDQDLDTFSKLLLDNYKSKEIY
jgi:patatin-like phospholipase/acyl hydrolase